MLIRSATADDAARILDIYAYYVENTAISFEHVAPSLDEFTNRIATTLEKYPYLVVEEEGEIQGYAYAGPYKTRASYDRSCETSIYVKRSAKGNGYGRALYAELENRLKEIGILNLYACIASPIEEDEYLTKDSERFHAHLGFQKVGEFHQCAHKFDRWYNSVWMEKIIGEHI